MSSYYYKLYVIIGIARVLIAINLFFAFNSVLNMALILLRILFYFFFIYNMIDTIHFNS